MRKDKCVTPPLAILWVYWVCTQGQLYVFPKTQPRGVLHWGFKPNKPLR